MSFIKLFFVPGAWLMRRMRLGGKLALLMAMMVLALVAVVWGGVWLELIFLGVSCISWWPSTSVSWRISGY